MDHEKRLNSRLSRPVWQSALDIFLACREAYQIQFGNRSFECRTPITDVNIAKIVHVFLLFLCIIFHQIGRRSFFKLLYFQCGIFLQIGRRNSFWTETRLHVQPSVYFIGGFTNFFSFASENKSIFASGHLTFSSYWTQIWYNTLDMAIIEYGTQIAFFLPNRQLSKMIRDIVRPFPKP